MKKQPKRKIHLSFDALDRICEEEAQKHPSLIALNPHCPSMRYGRSLTDEQLLEKLQGLGMHLDRAALVVGAKQHPSAEALSETLVRESKVRLPDTQNSDWSWVATAVLWERWVPEEPNFEMLGTRIDLGYESQEKDDSATAADIWLLAWQDVMALARKLNTDDMAAFDAAFGGSQCVFNWCQDLSHALWDAGITDPAYLRKGISYLESLLATFRGIDPLIAQNTRRAIADSHFALGEIDRGNTLYRAWLTVDPQWGWGWIGWSDCLAWPCYHVEDIDAAERILREGLAAPGVKNRNDILERLRDLRADQEGTMPALPLPSESASFTGEIPRQKAGRNDPCPCGSGRKFKKCCLSSS